MSDRVDVAISALEHYEYCPRQCALIHVDGMWLDNEHTVRGQHGHRRVDSGRARAEHGKTVLRSIPLWSDEYGLVGRSDAIEVSQDGSVTPVEYKIGTMHGKAAHLQLAAQGLCLEEMLGVRITVGYLYFDARRRRLAVPIDDDIRARTLAAVEEVRKTFRTRRLPGAPDDERCSHCQFLGYCLPDVVSHPEHVKAALGEALAS